MDLTVKISEADHIIDQIIHFVTKEALKGSTRNAFSYFKHLEEHINKHQGEQIFGSKHTYVYIEHLPIYSDILDQLPKSHEAYDIWRYYFPKKWKITVSNVRNYVVSRVWLNRFLDWSRSRIWSERKEWDQDLDEVSRELFPNVDPIIWAEVLVFIMRPWSGSRIQRMIEQDKNFGYVGRVFTGFGDGIETVFARRYEEQLKETINLAAFLFGGTFTSFNLNQWLTELNELSYPDNSDEFQRKEQWKEILTALKAHVEKNFKIENKEA